MFASVLIAAVAATIAAWAGLLALLQCRFALREARKAVIIAQRALDEATTLNAPMLLFSCEGREEKSFVDIWITAFNNGYEPSEVVSGRIIVHRHDSGQPEIGRDLQNVKIAGRREHVVRLRLDAAALCGADSGSSPLEIECEATYTREAEPNAYVHECFTYDPSNRIFLRKAPPEGHARAAQA